MSVNFDLKRTILDTEKVSNGIELKCFPDALLSWKVAGWNLAEIKDLDDFRRRPIDVHVVLQFHFRS
jgi:hypothetical protein